MRAIPVFLLFALLSACAEQPSAPDPAAGAAASGLRSEPPGARAGDAIPGRYIVVFRPGTPDASSLADRLVRAHGGTLHYTYTAALTGFAATLPERALAPLRAHPSVEIVAPDRVVAAAGVPTTQLDAPWGLDRIDQRSRTLDDEYNYVHTGRDVRVYVIDSGIRVSHAEFEGRASIGYDALGGTGDDCGGHGTQVAGLVGGRTFGVAKEARLVAVRVLGCGAGSQSTTPSGSVSAVVAGLDWVIAHHVKPAAAVLAAALPANTVVDQAAQRVVAAGVPLVVAGSASNGNACAISPARVPEAITVSATNFKDERSGFGAYGSCLDLFAPGEYVRTTWIAPDNSSIDMTGNSAAAGHAAGVAAVLLEQSPAATPAWVAQTLRATATPNTVVNRGNGSPNLLLSLPTVVEIRGESNIAVDLTACYYFPSPQTYEALPAGGNGTYAYQWQIRWHAGTGAWEPAGTGRTVSVNVCNQATMGSFDLRVTTTSAGYSGTDSRVVSVSYYVI